MQRLFEKKLQDWKKTGMKKPLIYTKSIYVLAECQRQ